MPEKRKVVMVDMDGTMTHSSWRNHLSPNHGGSWDAFHAECGKDKPTEVVRLVNALSKFFDVVVSTARPIGVLQQTSDWIGDHSEFTPLKIMMRNLDQMDLKSPELKKLHLESLRVQGYDVIIMIDDRKDVCEMFEEIGVSSMCVSPFMELGLDNNSAWDKQMYNDAPMIEKLASASFKKAKSPFQVLKDAAKFFKKRNRKYGDAWKRHGEIMAANFPDGITLKTPEDFFFMHCLVMDVVKTTRICNAFSSGEHHKDSWLDKIVYAAMAKSQIKD